MCFAVSFNLRCDKYPSCGTGDVFWRSADEEAEAEHHGSSQVRLWHIPYRLHPVTVLPRNELWECQGGRGDTFIWQVSQRRLYDVSRLMATCLENLFFLQTIKRSRVSHLIFEWFLTMVAESNTLFKCFISCIRVDCYVFWHFSKKRISQKRKCMIKVHLIMRMSTHI